MDVGGTEIVTLVWCVNGHLQADLTLLAATQSSLATMEREVSWPWRPGDDKAE